MPLALAEERLIFEFPAVHPDAVLEISFQRTLRVPDDGKQHGLPPGLGRFPLRAVDTLRSDAVPVSWRRRGGVALPMWQAEACWLSFRAPEEYPMAVKVAAGQVNALTGDPWSDDLAFDDPDYMEVPGQPWLDGFCVAKGVVRQFVAMPLGRGYTAEEQVTGRAEHGGIQILVRPLRAALWRERILAAQVRERAAMLERHATEREQLAERQATELQALERRHAEGRLYRHRDARGPGEASQFSPMPPPAAMAATSMGLGLGGSIRQVIARPKEAPEAWDAEARSRCFVHLADAAAWEALAGTRAPHRPPTAADYSRAGLPWFDYEDPGATPREGSGVLSRLRSVLTLGALQSERPLPENESFDPPEPVVLRPRPGRG